VSGFSSVLGGRLGEAARSLLERSGLGAVSGVAPASDRRSANAGATGAAGMFAESGGSAPGDLAIHDVRGRLFFVASPKTAVLTFDTFHPSDKIILVTQCEA